MKNDPLIGNAMAVRIRARQEPTKAEPDVFDDRATVDHLVWSLRNNLDDLQDAHEKHPEYLMANRDHLFKATTKLELLSSLLSLKEAAE